MTRTSASSTGPRVACPQPEASSGACSPTGLRRPSPACDVAEAAIWDTLGGGWECLHGGFCEGGVSVEWHDFACTEPRDWARSFHPRSIELCLNLSGHARLSGGMDSALFASGTAGFYHAGDPALAAWRLPGERHQFLTVEYAWNFLLQHLRGQQAALHPVIRRVLNPTAGGRDVSPVFPLTPPLRAWLERLRQPPVSGPALGVWYQGQALALMAEFFFKPDGTSMTASPRQRQVARERIERVIRILGQRLEEPPSLEALGREVGCSPYHLSRTFSREMGLTLPQYLRQIRMERAAELLKSGRFNVTEAALEVGYSSLSHFSHAFRETMGCCPGLYPLGQLVPTVPPPQPAAKESQPTGSRP
jgi:AraC family transcriptional regulator